MRVKVCTIYNCSYTGDRRCCVDCGKNCLNRCLNHPDRCKCWADEEARKQGQRKGSVSSERVLELADAGYSYGQIATKMSISIGAVGYHLQKMGYSRKGKRGDTNGR